MTTLQAVWVGIGIGMLLLLVIAWLKGAFGLVRVMVRKLAHESGEPWTLGAAAEPFGAAVVVFFIAAVGLASPTSRWARWFYGEQRMARARQRHQDDTVDAGEV